MSTHLIHHQFEAQSRRKPDAIAVTCGAEQLTYAELNRRANGVAHYLRGCGVGPDIIVGICFQRSVDMLIGMLAVLKAGGAYLPLDPAYPSERLVFMLQDSGAEILLTHTPLAECLPDFHGHIAFIDYESCSSPDQGHNVVCEMHADNLAYVIYTSGSTGLPKGVQVCHRTVIELFAATHVTLGIQEDDTWTVVHSYGFDFSVWEIWGALLHGCRLVVVPIEVIQAPDEFFLLLHTEKVTILNQTPTAIRQLLNAVERRRELLPLRIIICGGEAFPTDMLDQLLSLGVALWNFYGPTEATVWSMIFRVQAKARNQGIVSLGNPLQHMRYYLLNEDLLPVIPGAIGELYLGGDGLARGYYNRPGLTAERFLPDPFATSSGARMYRTGDLARCLDDDTIEYIGRTDYQVKIRGFRIELGEIESALLQHLLLKEVVVTALQDFQNHRLVAYLVPNLQGMPELEQHISDYPQRRQIEHWRQVYDEVYNYIDPHADLTSDFSGWISSYDRRSIPRHQMQEWLDSTVDRLLRLRPNNVLEIGCGTGILLLRLAPGCNSYYATDIAPSALRRLAQVISDTPGLEHSFLSLQPADVFDGIPIAHCDTVILNSVVQYFPSQAYLHQIVAHLVQNLASGSSIFIGDIRSMALLEPFHTATQLSQATESTSSTQLFYRVEQALLYEEELVIDPTFFYLLQKRHPQIAHVHVQLKRGAHHNELTRYRYDVTLSVGDTASLQSCPVELEWYEIGDLSTLVEHLRTQSPQALVVRRVPNARLYSALQVRALLMGQERPEMALAIREAIGAVPSRWLDPIEFWNLEKIIPYDVDILWSGPGAEQFYDVIFLECAEGASQRYTVRPLGIDDALETRWEAFTNRPILSQELRKLVPECQRLLQEKLPEYMVPSAFVVLRSLPVTANNKLNRQALPLPEAANFDLPEGYIAPRTMTEKLIAGAWSSILGIPTIGIDDNFFALGGHSLLATQIISRIRDMFGVDLSLQDLFQAPTISDLANLISVRRSPLTDNFQGPEARHRDNSPYVLSFAQQRLWFFDQLEPSSTMYTIPVVLRLLGPLQVSALHQGFDLLIARHASLRTHFGFEDGVPIQRTRPPYSLPLNLVDLQTIAPEEHEHLIAANILQQINKPFDLCGDHLLRVHLIRLDAEEHVLIINIHHIISDAWSLDVLFRELTHFYHAVVTGQPNVLPDLPLQYTDVVRWQHEVLHKVTRDAQLAYWIQHLNDAPPLLELPTDYPRPAILTFRGAKHTVILPRTLADKLSQLGRQEGATLFMVGLAAFDILLTRYSGQDDIVIGVPIANRSRSEFEGLIGLFVNTLALRLKTTGEEPFSLLLQQVRQVTLEVHEYQDLPFEQVVEAIQPDRTTSYTPLFQVMFDLQHNWVNSLNLKGISIEEIPVEHSTAKFDLLLDVMETYDGLRCVFEYNTELFSAVSIERMAGHWRTILEHIVSDANMTIGAIPILTETEIAQQALWNNTLEEIVPWEPVDLLIARQATLTPDRHAVVFAEEGLTYYELNHKANQLTHYLRAAGVGPEVRVAIHINRSTNMVVALLAVLKAGGAFVPLDPAYPHERLLFMLDDSQVAILITQQELVGTLQEFPGTVVALDTLQVVLAHQPSSDPGWTIHPDNLAFIIYTSGSTGTPKGAMITHGGLVNYYYHFSQHYNLRSTISSHLQMASFSFDVFIADVVRSLCNGAKLVMCSYEEVVTPALLYARMLQEHVDSAEFVPAVLKNLLEYLEETGKSLTQMRLLMAGADAWPVQDFYRVRQRCGPDTRLLNVYGLTEATIDNAHLDTGGAQIPSDGFVPIGRPITNNQLYVLDRRLQPVPVGVAGELYIGGVGVGRGYFKRPDLTAERFIPDPFSQQLGARLYRTGDVVRLLPDGTVAYLGRTDQQVKIRGFRVELGEVETVLRDSSLVANAVVVVHEVENVRRLVAYVVLCSHVDDAETRLRQWANASLPPYMLPSAYVFLPALPITPNGKLDRRALPPPELTLSLEWRAITPRNPVEAAVADIWRDVLRVDHLSIRDDFFELGGHSLLAAQVVARVRTVLQVELPLRTLFENPTVETLAQVISTTRLEQPVKWPSLEPIARDRPISLSFAQQRLWFIDQLDPGSPLYNIHEVVQIHGLLDLEAFTASLQEIIRRHEILRTTFPTLDGQPYQLVSEHNDVSFLLDDLPDKASTKREHELREISYSEAQHSFQLEQGPLLRMRLVKLSPQEHCFLFTMHHIISDGWSTNLFLTELCSIYDARVGNFTPKLEELRIQYADYAEWQRLWLQGTRLKAQEAYWLRQLADMPPMLQLPTDYPRPQVQTHAGVTERLYLAPELVNTLKILGRREGVTMSMILLTALKLLLYRYSGQSDVCVGSPIANRTHPNVEALIGFFINTLVLRTDLSGNPTVQEALARVRHVSLDAYDHQDLPFERLIELLQPERSLSHTPLFQVMFIFQSPSPVQETRAGLRFVPVVTEVTSLPFDLVLEFQQQDEGIHGWFSYNTALFTRDTIISMVAHFHALLAAITLNPSCPITQLPLSEHAEAAQNTLVATVEKRPNRQCVHSLFEEQVKRSPELKAVMFGDAHLTYSQLDKRAERLTRVLQAHGVGPETVIGICLERSLELVICVLAILKAGAAYLPLDPSYPDERLHFMLADSRVLVLLTQRSFSARLAQTKVALVYVDEHLEDEPDAGLMVKALAQVASNNLAYVIYTSGSTGKPKGVGIEHGQLCNTILAQIKSFELSAQSNVLQFASLSFDAFASELFTTLLAGATLVMAPREQLLPGPELVNLLRSSAITAVTLPPSVLSLLPQDELPALTTLIVAGEACPPRLVQRWGTGRRFINAYGPTEGTICATAGVCQPNHFRPSIGQPISHAEVYVLDSFMQQVPGGMPGEIYIGGAGVARGYMHRPELTAERFVPHPFSSVPGARLYRTGDRGRYLPDGNLDFLGRIDQQIKVRGFRIEPGEIERVLETHPEVQKSVVLLHTVAPDDVRLACVVVPQPLASPSQAELRLFAQRLLPSFMVPVVFCVVESLPLTPNGKLNRRVLEQIIACPRVAEQQPASFTKELERTIATVWGQVLGIEIVDTQTSFFDLGGHSLLLPQVLMMIQERTGHTLSMVDLFTYPTISSLANYLQPTLTDAPLAPSAQHRAEQRLSAEARRRERRQRGNNEQR